MYIGNSTEEDLYKQAVQYIKSYSSEEAVAFVRGIRMGREMEYKAPKDICLDFCESKNCNGCPYENMSLEERERIYRCAARGFRGIAKTCLSNML